MSMKINPLNAIDFYKADHRSQYPKGTEYVYSNLTPRAVHEGTNLIDFDNRVVFFGLQGFIKHFLIETWNQGFFLKPKKEVVATYKNRMDSSLGVGAIDMQHIEELHDLGYLPIKIKALPEGSRVNLRVAMFTIVNTNPKFFWLTNYLETVMSSEIWKSCTTATISYQYKKLLTSFAQKTGGSLDFVPVQAHDFSARGMSGVYDATQTGVGHLTNFIGTDSVSAIDYAEEYYNATGVIGVSVPATEHSVMCMGTQENEIGTIRRLIKELYPTGIVSIVADTWDFWQVINDYALVLKDDILSRKVNSFGLAKVVFRPDSGDPVKIICGDPSAPVDSPEFKGAVECLWGNFGGTLTSKGFKQLNERVGVIYGDSITLARANAILTNLEKKGFASTNIVFGVGSYTYQYNTRDTFGFAMKATWGQVNGVARNIFKAPKTDSGVKKSAKGLIRVEKNANGFVMFDEQTPQEENSGELKVIFLDGRIVKETSLNEVRNLLAI